MKLLISNSSNKPIYEQIQNQVKASIIKGEIKEGEMMPSIRALAKELHISVITTKRAYEELEKEGFVETVKGKGTFVAPQNRELLKEQKMQIIEQKLLEAIKESRFLGISYDELKDVLKILYFNE